MNKEFTNTVNDIVDYWWKSNPVNATMDGIHDYDHEIGNMDADSRNENLRQYENYIDRLRTIERESELSRDERLDLEVLKRNLSVVVQMERNYRRADRDATVYTDMCLWSAYMLLTRDFAPLEQRMKSLASRLEEIPRILEQGKVNLLKSDDVPAAWTRIGMEVTQSGLNFFSVLVPMYANRIPSLTTDLQRANDNAIRALESYLQFLNDKLMPRSKGEFRLGEELFDYCLRENHILPFTSEELLEFGRQAIADTEIELQKSAASIDEGKSWRELVDLFRTDVPKPSELLDQYRKEIVRARTFVDETGLVDIPTNESLQVVETPRFEVSRYPYAAYLMPPPFEGSSEGVFWVTPVDLDLPEEQQQQQLAGHSKSSIILKAIHEGYPGHHLQFVHTNRLESKPRRVFATSSFTEGWALYCEELMYEQGYYDLKTRLFMLKDQLWRACRVVIDVELHRGNMSFQDAVKTLVEKAGLEEVNAISEIKRYTQSPTQPMSYMTGKDSVKRLRDRVKNKLGSDFELNRFHNELLSYGSIPVGLIENEMLNQ